MSTMSNAPRATDAYACSHLGAIALAYDLWEVSCREHDRATTDADRMLYTGRAGVASELVRHGTGRRPAQIRETALATGSTPHEEIAAHFAPSRLIPASPTGDRP